MCLYGKTSTRARTVVERSWMTLFAQALVALELPEDAWAIIGMTYRQGTVLESFSE